MQGRKIVFVMFLWIGAGISVFAQQKPYQCGNWRWDVKTLTDKGGAALLKEAPMQTLFDRVLSEQPPKVLKASDMEDGKLPRYPSENGVVQFTAYVTSATISSDDHDYRLVLKSPESESVMLGESPDPSCPTFNAFPQLRTTFIQAGKDISNIMELLKSNNKPVKVSVTGVPFWDAPDPQKGGNPGGLEIHPLLKVSVISD